MTFATHGDQKYQDSLKLAEDVSLPMLGIEYRQFQAGPQKTVVPTCTELVVVLAGGGRVKRMGNGIRQESLARPGTSYIVPVGTYETRLELSDQMECLHLYLPSTLIDQSALSDYDIDPATAELAYADGLSDELLFQICSPLRGLLNRPRQPTDGLFVDGIQTALAAHLLGSYSVSRWRPPEKAPTLDPRRLQRVLDYIESLLGTDIRLEDLASEACLSPFHFSRLFRAATGKSPHSYVTDRRIMSARAALAQEHRSLVDIALDVGFASQDNFTRNFKKATGLTPGQYRRLCAG